MKLALLFLLSVTVNPAFAGGFGPWTFGMSSEEIQALSTHGPYASFSNGDLETYNGEFGGKKENVQFFLNEGRLWRIGVYTYEGTDIEAATQTWARTYLTLQQQYGPLETPGYSGATGEARAKAARALVEGGGKAQMAPMIQPTEEFVFSSFTSFTSGGATYYRVTVNYDQPAVK